MHCILFYWWFIDIKLLPFASIFCTKFNANHVSAWRTSPVAISSSRAGLCFCRVIFEEGLVPISYWWWISCVFGCSFRVPVHGNLATCWKHCPQIALRNTGKYCQAWSISNQRQYSTLSLYLMGLLTLFYCHLMKRKAETEAATHQLC